MFFAAALAVAAASASIALAQDVSIDDATLTQCANTTFTYNAPAGSYYAAVVPAQNACTSDPLAEFYNVTSGIIDYFVNIPAGTQVQVYIADSYDDEWWSDVLTVGDGDSSCLGDASSSSTSSTSTSSTSTSSTSSTSTSTTSTTSTSSTPSVYVAPANFATVATTAATSAASDSSIDDTPANAATGGASNVAISFTLLGGALLVTAALL